MDLYWFPYWIVYTNALGKEEETKIPIIALDLTKWELYLGYAIQGLFTGIGVLLAGGIAWLFKDKIIRGILKKIKTKKQK